MTVQVHLLVALILGLLVDVARSVVVTAPESVVVGKVGSDVILPCTYSTTVGTSFTLEWRFSPPATIPVRGNQIYYYTNGQTYQPGSQASRISISKNPPTAGIGSLRLSNIQQSDAGSYTCEVNNPPDFSGTGSNVINLRVLVPPSPPSCHVNGNTNVGSDVTLACSSTSGVPKPIYSWSRVGSKTTLLPGTLEDQIKGTLLLTNISQTSSGTYTCVSSNELGRASCELTLTVIGTVEAGVIAGAVIGAFFALLIIVLIVVFMVCCYRKRKQKDTRHYPGSEIRDDADAPRVRHSSQRTDRSGSSLLARPEDRHASSRTVNTRFQAIV